MCSPCCLAWRSLSQAAWHSGNLLSGLLKAGRESRNVATAWASEGGVGKNVGFIRLEHLLAAIFSRITSISGGESAWGGGSGRGNSHSTAECSRSTGGTW